jgi:hypothetical protein
MRNRIYQHPQFTLLPDNAFVPRSRGQLHNRG